MILKASGAALPDDRVLDGHDPTPVVAGEAHSLHDVLSWEYHGTISA